MERYIEVKITAERVMYLAGKAREKVEVENWEERKEVKAKTFTMAWVSEDAWKTLLDERNIRYEWADTYVGTVEDAPLDFIMWFGGVKKTIGIRSRMIGLLRHYKQVPYPDDRVKLKEWKRIEDYTVASSIYPTLNQITEKGATVRFYGAIEKKKFIPILQKTLGRLSTTQRERFRPVDLHNFDYSLMCDLLKKADRRR